MRNVKVLKHFEVPNKPGTYARLLCLTGEDKGSAYFLEGPRIVLGRGDQCDITIKDLKTSREHAEMAKVGKDYVMTDLGSHNGIVINDLKIKQHRLNHGDKIILGKTVYKFGFVDVKNEAKEILKKANQSSNSEDEPRKGITPRTGIFILLFAVAFWIIFDESNSEIVEPTQQSSGEFNEISTKLVSEISNRERRESNKIKEGMSVMFQRGLREYREGNYFRALEQFNLALSNKPNDALALFYRRKTVEALDNQIEGLFIQARRDRDSLKYEASAVSYCAIQRLLYSIPEDKRYKDAQKYFDEVTVLRGYEKNEVTCK
jgi:pSer/pThr/pTyr-binding forkhead associated (FHA) protein